MITIYFVEVSHIHQLNCNESAPKAQMWSCPGQVLCLKHCELWTWGKTQAEDGMEIYKYINNG